MNAPVVETTLPREVAFPAGAALPVPHASGGDRLDLSFVLAALRRRARLMLGIVAGAVALTFIVVSRQPYVYSATAQVVLNMREERIAPASTLAEAVLPNAERADTEAAVLKSRALAEDVADTLHLDADPAFAPGRRSSPGVLDSLRWAFGVGRGVVARVLTPADIRRAVVDKLQAGLTVARSDQTFVLDITYNAASAIDAARIANEFARQYAEGATAAKDRKQPPGDGLSRLAPRIRSGRRRSATPSARRRTESTITCSARRGRR